MHKNTHGMRTGGGNAAMERKDGNGGGDQSADLKKSIDAVMTGFEEFKSTNDARMVEIEKKGSADPLLDEKLAKLETTLGAYEGAQQKFALADAQKKAIDDMQEQFDKLETAMKRVGNGSPEVKTASRINDWGRAVVLANELGVANLDDAQRKVLADVTAEYKALSVSGAAGGGYLAPSELVREIIKGETEISPVRALARVRQTMLKSVEIPKRKGQFAAQWVAEQGTKNETTGLAYGVEEIPTHEFYALIDISNQMLEDSAFDMEGELRDESAEQFALAEGTSFVTGNGIGKPEGFMTSSEVTSTASGTATTIADANGQADGLLTLKHSLKTAYARNATWVMNRTTLGSVRKLKDGNNQYIWMPGIAQGKPNTIDGDPYVEMPDMPSEGAGLKPIAYGDFRRAYTWVDRIIMEMLRDPYTQATAGNIRFIMRKRVGGQVTLGEALKTLTCST